MEVRPCGSIFSFPAVSRTQSAPTKLLTSVEAFLRNASILRPELPSGGVIHNTGISPANSPEESTRRALRDDMDAAKFAGGFGEVLQFAISPGAGKHESVDQVFAPTKAGAL